MANTLTYSTTLVVTSCWCGIGLAIPEDLYRIARQKGHAVYCPLGHTFVFGNTEIEQLKKELANQKQIIVEWANDYGRLFDQKKGVERSLAATKGVVTRIKKRVANGVCPCCNRHFTNLERHMKGQHPEWHAEEVPASHEQ